jgi:hypothetical protein
LDKNQGFTLKLKTPSWCQNPRMKNSLATQIRDKTATIYVAGIVGFSALVSIVATIILIVNRNSS